MEQVIIGVDPHKLSATIEVVDHDEVLLGSGRFTTDQAGYKAMRTNVKAWSDRVWAVEGANGVGRPLAQRLLESGERVVDVPAKLAARVRLFDSGHNRKTDAHDAHSIAMVAVRTKGLRLLRIDGELEAMRMLTDRREALTRQRVQTVDRLQALLAELLPGQAKRDITTGQAKRMLATVRPRDVAGKTRRCIAAEELAELDEYAFAAIKAGAAAFLLKDAAPPELLGAIRSVHAGDSVVAPSTTRRLLEHFAAALPDPATADEDDRLSVLTEREREVLELVGRGRSNREIAQDLVVAEATVKTHISRLLAKTASRDRVQLVVLAYEAGVVRPA